MIASCAYYRTVVQMDSQLDSWYDGPMESVHMFNFPCYKSLPLNYHIVIAIITGNSVYFRLIHTLLPILDLLPDSNDNSEIYEFSTYLIKKQVLVSQDSYFVNLVKIFISEMFIFNLTNKTGDQDVQGTLPFIFRVGEKP